MRPKDRRTSKTCDFRLSLDGIGSREGASSALPELHGRKRSDEALLRPVRKSEALQTLVADDPLQSLRAAHLTLTVSAKLREMDDIIKTARMSGLDI